MSMRWRLVGAFGLIILIALGTVAIVARYRTEQEVQTFLGHGGQVGLENLADNLESYYAKNNSWSGVESSSRGGQGRGMGQGPGASALGGDHTLADASGRVILSPISNQVGAQLSESTLAQSIPLQVSGQIVGYLIPEGGVPQLPDDFESLLIERVNNASLLAALISGGIAILLGLILAALILKPVRVLTKAATKLSKGDLSERVDIRGGGELKTLGETFNAMAQSLQEVEDRRMAMTADIAHELRNPLAIQRAHLEAMQDGLYPLTQENLVPLAEQNQQLTHLVEDLRMLALAEAGQLALNMRRVNLSTICRETVHRFEPQANMKDIQLIGHCADQAIFADVDKERIQQILDNLMQNALRYSPEGGWIKITLEKAEGWAVFCIHNNGPQITSGALSHLFERFYRADKARDRASGGTGLGLAIARQLAEAHGGKLIAENHPDGGVIFKLFVHLS